MLFSAEVRTKELARLCRNLSRGLEAGLPLVQVMQRTTDGSYSAALTMRLKEMSHALSTGENLEAALSETGTYFPRLFRELVSLGEKTGQLPEVLKRLADSYDLRLKMRQEFISAISWPLLQLVAAIFIIGFLIWILGVISEILGSEALDITGLGLVGTKGVIIYFTVVTLIFISLWLGYEAFRRGVADSIALHRFVLNIPVVGPALRILSLSQIAWSMQLAFDTDMPLKESIPLVLASTPNRVYQIQTDQIVRKVLDGESLSLAFSEAGDYPSDFLDTLEVGEQTGQIPESMEILATQYRERAQTALATLAKVAGFLVWACVAIILVAMILRIFYVAYLKPIQELL
ncbi:Hypothetical protein PBC10988_1510 [Planctomycetales bacterium 10988]|nr:Hypothetical protein PBC10988_1510 [Planctomycetales bacterium 10988]